MVWIIDWSQPGACEHNVDIYDTHDCALAQAVKEIQSFIQDCFDLQFDLDREAAKGFNDLVKIGNHSAAIHYWNNCEANVDSERAAYWIVREVKSNAAVITASAWDDSFFPPLYTDQDVSEEDDTDDYAEVYNQSVEAVNDHVCGCCGNDKCSKAEKSCWKCGATI